MYYNPHRHWRRPREDVAIIILRTRRYVGSFRRRRKEIGRANAFRKENAAIVPRLGAALGVYVYLTGYNAYRPGTDPKNFNRAVNVKLLVPLTTAGVEEYPKKQSPPARVLPRSRQKYRPTYSDYG